MLRLYLGSAAGEPGATFTASTFAFGFGLGYDIFSKKDTIFSALTLTVDWLATRGDGDGAGALDTSPYAIEEGGALIFGLKVRMGI
jgi:hypothetical protein